MPWLRKALPGLCIPAALLVLVAMHSGVAGAAAPVNACSYQQSGMDMSAAINAAILANPSAVIDARCFAAYSTGTTPQSWSMNIFSGVSTPGELLLGVANVNVSAAQNVPSGWHIVGAGPGVTVLTAVSNSGGSNNWGAVLQVGSGTQAGTSNVQIDGLEINGSGPGQLEIPIQIQDAAGVWVTHSYIHDSTSSNVGIDTNNPTGGGSTNIHVEANRIGVTHGCNTFDVQVGQVTSDFYIKDNFIFGSTCYGVGADGSSHGIISGNDISATGNAANSGGGIQVEATNGKVNNVVIANNVIHDFTAASTAFGIAFVIGNSNRTLTDVLIEGNIVANFSGRGIYVGNTGSFTGFTCQNAVVKGNTVHDVTMAGIRVVGCGIAQVEGNNVYNAGTSQPGGADQDGISLSSTTGFVVSGNTVTDVPANGPTNFAITLDGNTGDGFVVGNYAKGTARGAINNSATGSDIQVLTNHTT
jgi:hypothetical protein